MDKNIILNVIAIFILVWMLVIVYSIADKELNDKFWEKKFQCIEYNGVFELDEDTYGCPLSCERLSTRSGTDVDRCSCEWNNKTVYRYCRSKMPVYEYVGVKNESNLLSID